MPRKKDVALHAANTRQNVVNTYRLVSAEYLGVNAEVARLTDQRDELQARRTELRNAALAMNVDPAELDN